MILPRVSRRIGLALWNMRLLGLFLVGPLAGIVIAGLTFGLPPALRWTALAMVLFCLALFGLLVRGEYGRISRAARR